MARGHISRQSRSRWSCAAILAIAALALVGCSTGLPGPGSPQASPSKSCGGYHLAIKNAAATSIAVTLNGRLVTTIAAGQSADIAQWGVLKVPLMPWDAQIVRTSDGRVLLSLRIVDDGMDGRTLTITDQPLPTFLEVAYVCGQSLT